MEKHLSKALTASERLRLLAMAKAAKAKRVSDLRPSITRVERNLPLMLSFGQERLLFLTRMEGLADAYHIPFSIGLQGVMDREALGKALDRIVARHESLRTTFVAGDGQPCQRIAPAEGCSFHLLDHDLRAHPEPDAELLRLSTLESSSPFNLEQGPLVRGRIVQLPEDRHCLLITMHHIVSDGWSMSIFISELAALYTAFCALSDDPLPEPVLHYADYAAWQRRWAFSDHVQKQADYWKTALAGAPEVLELPTDRVRPMRQDYSGAIIPFELEAGLSQRIKALGRKHGTTLFMTLLTAWGAFLSRLSGQDDLVIGTPAANRGRAEIEGMIGFFVNTLALRLDFSGSPSVTDMLQRVRLRALGAQDHQDIPFEQVVEVTRPTRSLAHSPLFQVMFIWQNMPESPLELPGLTVVPVAEISRTTAKFDLCLTLGEAGDIIEGGLEYATALFDRPTMLGYLGNFRTLLEAMAADDRQSIVHLPLLSDTERQQILEGWNDTYSAFPAERCIHELFEDQAARTPEALALVFAGHSLSYRELNLQANQLACHLRALGVGPDVRVAICIERSVEMVVGLLAILKAGGAYVPMDPAHPVDRLVRILEDSHPAVLLTHKGLSSLAAGLDTLVVDVGAGNQAWQDLPGTDLGRTAGSPGSRSLAYVIYTSGSTGTPKGVMVEHRGVVNLLTSMQQLTGTTSAERVLGLTTIAFDIAALELYLPLVCGACVVLVDRHLAADPDGLTESMRSHGVTLMQATPATWSMLIEGGWGGAANLKVLCGGEALSADLANRLRERVGVLWNVYGPTETTIWSTALPVDSEACSGSRVSLGHPVANTQVYILDGFDQPVPRGVTGEIHIGGAGVARGYFNRPQLTAEKFVRDPFSRLSDARMYRTGDLGRWLSDGTIEFLGRNDFQVKIRGFRIELGEIEATLAAHPDVREAVVLAREDVPGDKHLVAYITGTAPLPAETLRAHLAATLPDFMVPAAYVHLDALPLTPNGKLDRNALPAPDVHSFASQTFELPQGEMEIRVAAIWSDLLKIDRIGRYDNFFELGGHSLLTVQLLSRLRTTLGLEVQIGDFFDHPVLADFARIVDSAARTELPTVTPALPAERASLSFAQQRLWFLAQLEATNAAYHMVAGQRLKGDLDRDALRAALDGVLVRHEALRTTIGQVDGSPIQCIAAEASFQLIEHDLRAHSDPEAELVRLATEEATAPFDLTHGPLARGRLLRLTPSNHVLLITMHHVISDGWSMGVFIRDLNTFYTARRGGRRNPLPPLEIQYADYAAWQRRWLKGDLLQRQATYWKTMLAGAPTVLELPTDHPRPSRQDYAGASFEFALDPDVADGMRALSQRHGTTLFLTFLAAWAALLSRLSGQQDLVIGTPTANRGRQEIEGLIGFFTNTLALRVDLTGSPTVSELMERVKARALEAQHHQDIPFEQVVEIAQPARSLAHSPLFQVMFSWNDSSQGSLSLPGLEVESLGLMGHGTSQFDLSLALWDSGWTISGGLEYATALFEKATIERHFVHFQTLLRAMLADEAQSVDRLPILDGAEHTRVLVEWNDTAHALPATILPEMFERQAGHSPDHPAVEFEGQVLTYGELNARANRLAHHLHALGVRPDDRAAICCERSLDMVVGLLAILKAGGAYVPLGPGLPDERIAFVLDDATAVVVLTQTSLVQRFTALANVPVLDLAQTASWANRPSHNLDARALGLNLDHLAYVLYTSGSTGTPKGVMVEHRHVCHQVIALQLRYELSARDRVLQFAAITFDVSVEEIFGALCHGAALVLRTEAWLQDFWAMAGAHGITVANLPTLFWQQLVLDGGVIPECLRQIIIGGDAAASEAISLWLRREGHRPRLFNAYGPTETTVNATIQELTPQTKHLQSIGGPIANTQIYILDGHGHPVPVGVTGEIHIGGAGVARGYLNRPELTAEKFVRDPFSTHPGARMYRSGDLGRWLPDGTIAFLGRNDFQVKIRGFRIEPGEIEAALTACPAVREAIVVAREDSSGDRRLIAYYTASEALAAETMRNHLSTTLPDYMVPAAYVHLDFLPLNASGKLDRKALPAPEVQSFTIQTQEPPQGPIEILLAAIWKDLLKLDHVGRHDNFFELGGHSLLAISLIERMRRQDLHVEVSALFLSPRLCELAAAVRSESALVVVPPNLIPLGAAAITPDMLTMVMLSSSEIECVIRTVPGGARNVQDIYPLAPLQEGILFHHRIATEGDVYLLSSLYSFDTRARLDGYLAAMQSVIDRHDVLRTAVVWEGLPEPVQVVWRSATLPVEEVTLATCNPGDDSVDARARELLERFDPAHCRIDLTQAPMLRAFVAPDTEPGSWLLLLLNHHLSGDHSSQEIVNDEIRAHLLGEADALPAPTPFRNLVAQARLGMSSDAHEAFFRKLLGDVDEPTAPFGLLNVQGNGSAIQEAYIQLDGEFADRMRQRARKLGVSAAALCHVAWARVLAQTCGRDDVVFGTVLLGRMQGSSDAGRGMGLFMNTLPLRFRIGDEPVVASIQRMHVLLAGLMHHEHAPLALAQRCSAVPAPTPLFSALLNYRHNTGHVDATASQAIDGMALRHISERTNYPLTLSVDDCEEGFWLTALTDPSISPAMVCAFMRTALEGLVDALEVAPATPLSSIDVLPSEERNRVLQAWNATYAEFPTEHCIHEMFEDQAARTPEAPAVVLAGDALTYGELNARANRLAHHLLDVGVVPDARVAICMERGLDMVVGLLAILKAGGAYVPLDPAYPSDRLRFMLDDSAPVVMLTQASLREQWKTAPGLAVVVLDDPATAALLHNAPEHNPDPHALGLTPRHLAYVIYTSGSTGQPKGVMVEHGNVTRLFAATDAWFHFNTSDVWMLFHSFAFDFSVWEIWGALLHGGRLVVVPRDIARSSVDFYRLVCQSGGTVLNQTPSAFRQFIAAQAESTDTHRLRTVIFGGEALEPATLKQWFIQNGDQPTQLINMYGITETTVHVTYRPIVQADTSRRGSSPIGSCIPDLTAYILDTHGQPVPIGVSGELHIGGAGVARGYLNRPDLTAERFLLDPFAGKPDARMYRTGDLGKWLPDGTIEFLGRNDFQVKIRGFRIELGEIEARLSEHPEVREAVVLAREDSPGDKRLVAYYVAATDGEAAVGAEALRSCLLGQLPEYMVPAAYVRLDSLPLTPNGKLDRKALPAPGIQARETQTFQPAEGVIEVRMAAIWADLLKLDRVGRHDNFFELGGHSLLVIRVINRLKEVGISLAVADLFSYPTLAAAAAIAGASRAPLSRDRAVVLRAARAGNPLFLVHDGFGDLAYAHRLVAHLGHDFPIHGLPCHSSEQSHLRTLQEMAARLIEVMCAVQPAGPYRIAGWSLGGFLAYEVATQLLGRGRQVEFLGLLDSHAMRAHRPQGEKELLFAHAWPLADQDETLMRDVAALRERSDAMDFPSLVQALKVISLIPEASTDQDVRWLLTRMQALASAVADYHPHPLPIPVHLFVAQDEVGGECTRDWEHIVPDGLFHPIRVAGHHFSMMREPCIRILATAVDRVLEQIETQRAPLPAHHSPALQQAQARSTESAAQHENEMPPEEAVIGSE